MDKGTGSILQTIQNSCSDKKFAGNLILASIIPMSSLAPFFKVKIKTSYFTLWIR